MGHNISGIAINKNFENNIDELSSLLGVELQLDKEIDFEDASENWKEEGYFDIYFSKNGTLVFANIDYCLEPYSHKENNILTFALSETSMTFNIGYTENGEVVRSIMKVNDEVLDEEGEPLQSEIDNEDDMTEAIFDQIGEVLGIHFYEIELDEKAYRFNLKTEDEKVYIDYNQKVKEQSSKNTTLVERKTNLQTQKKSNYISKYKKVNNGILSKGIGTDLLIIIISMIFLFAAMIGLIYVIVSIFNLP